MTATAGRKGHWRDVRGGRVVASSYRVHNSYFAAAVRTEPQSDPAEFLADAQHFFGALKRDFFVWVPADDLEIRSAALAIGGVLEPNTTPAMSIRFPVPGGTSRFAVKPAMTSEAYEQFGQAVEAGYETPGLGWLLRDQDFFSAPGSIWVTAYDGDEPLGAACGYMSGTTGGVYFVGTPPQHRGKGVGADVTRAVVDILFEQGATSVTLQSSAMGFRIYETLGFTVCGHYERCVIGPRQD
ncbi:MAG: GNAT family N-acetyltransferase [Hyphomonadaceae bacterium]|nr:GNAT family N-acetyltransferase [Hyphomonadaceae bacterium]